MFAPKLCQEEQKVFVWDRKENPYEKIVKKAEDRARNLNIRLKRPFLTAGDVPVCEENPLRNLYISAQGHVSPCVYLHPPLPSPFKRIFCGREQWVEKVSFGNAFEVPFPAIWNSPPYLNFRSRFLHRQRKSKELFLSLLEGAKPGAHQQEAFPEPPDPCKSCHKILGL